MYFTLGLENNDSVLISYYMLDNLLFIHYHIYSLYQLCELDAIIILFYRR